MFTHKITYWKLLGPWMALVETKWMTNIFCQGETLAMLDIIQVLQHAIIKLPALLNFPMEKSLPENILYLAFKDREPNHIALYGHTLWQPSMLCPIVSQREVFYHRHQNFAIDFYP